SVRNAQGTHEPDRLQVADDRARLVRRQVADRLEPHRLAKLVLELTAARCERFLERLLVGIELGRGLRRYADVLEKTPPDRCPDAPAVEDQPVAVALVELIHLARKRATIESADRAVLTKHGIDAFLTASTLELVKRHWSMAQGVAHCLGQAAE